MKTLFVAAVISTAFTVCASAQTTAAGGRATQPQRPATVDESHATAMMVERQQMMANMRAMDQKLNDLIKKMDAARGTDKVDALAVVVKELVAQRTQMQNRMMAMHDEMMQHMMQHMAAMQGGMMSMMGNRGGQPAAMLSMNDCPMMKELSKEQSSADHAEHHP